MNTMITCVVLIGGIAIFLWYMDRENKKLKEQRERMEEEERCERERKEDEDIKLMNDLKKMAAKIEVMNQAKAVGDDKTVEAIMNENYHGMIPEKHADGLYPSMYPNLMILKIAGINFRQGINRYTGRVMCALVPEPDNEYDQDAIKIVAEDRHHLGYIPTEHTYFVRSLAGDTFPYRCEAHIYEAEDETDGHKFFYGFVYIKRKDKGE